eukprot:TRINITY_DN59330_c0_g1_i1.p1 TRINITY_DN59330_c0_g1~~TRINITY_DN59330_c0_g1_i1.p1  ORF type:complete len:840 (+),score=196.89 TRINITY_DN59330_c0_g1_i1:126-2645(+)
MSKFLIVVLLPCISLGLRVGTEHREEAKAAVGVESTTVGPAAAAATSALPEASPQLPVDPLKAAEAGGSSSLATSTLSHDSGNGENKDAWDHFREWIDKAMGKMSAADVSGVKNNQENDVDSLGHALLFNCCATMVTLVLWLVFRKIFPATYIQRTELMPRASMRQSSWLLVASAHLPEDVVVAEAGLDGLMLVEYYRLGKRLVYVLSLVVLGFLCPLNYYCAVNKDRDFLTLVGVGGVEGTSHPQVYWAHAAAVWLIVLATISVVEETHSKFLDRRFRWLRKLPMPRATTIMVENIPRQYCSDDALRVYFNRLFGDFAVQRAYVVRRTQKLLPLVKKRDALRESLAEAEAAWEAAGRPENARPQTSWSCGGWLALGEDAINLYSRQYEEYRQAAEAERLKVEAAVPSANPAVCSTAGFVTFSTRRLCLLAANMQYRPDASQFKVGNPPAPDDVNYADLSKPVEQRTGSDISAVLLIVFIFIVWLPVVLTISGFTNLQTLRQFVPFVDTLCESHPKAETVIEGVLSTIVLKLFMALLPTLLLGIIDNLLTLKSKTHAQRRLQAWFFAFQVIFVLLITAIGRSLIDSVIAIVNQPRLTLVLLANSLPNASHFYMNYMALGWFAESLELLRHSQLMRYTAFRVMGYCHEEAHTKSEPEDRASCGIGARSAKAALSFTIMIVFCMCSPLILAVAGVYFTLGSMTFSYLVVFAEKKKPDTGGAFWITGVKQVLFGLVIFVLLMTGILMSRYQLGRGPAVLSASSLLAITMYFRRFNSMIWDKLPFETLADEDYAEGNSLQRAVSKLTDDYVQAECLPEMGRAGSLSGASSNSHAGEAADSAAG